MSDEEKISSIEIGEGYKRSKWYHNADTWQQSKNCSKY